MALDNWRPCLEALKGSKEPGGDICQENRESIALLTMADVWNREAIANPTRCAHATADFRRRSAIALDVLQEQQTDKQSQPVSSP